MLQAHQYGRKMQTYQPPPENLFETVPSDEEILLRTIYSQWVDVSPSTRDNLLRFETPGFELPRMATGKEDVKILVRFMFCWTVLFSTDFCVQLGQLNDIVRLCQLFDLKVDMSEADWPLLMVWFSSYQINGITEVGRNALTDHPSF
jgi:hypothetical protein